MTESGLRSTVYSPVFPTNLSEVFRWDVILALVSLELHSENTLFRAHTS